MDQGRLTTAAVLLALTAGPPAAGPLAAGELTPQEKRGKQVFLAGTSPSGAEITALMGDEAVEVPAGALPCSSCHGYDGRGRPEGGVSPSNLTWEALSKPYGVRTESGREHPPYTPKDLKKAIGMGFDPAGNKLNIAMPRYRMTIRDMDDLIAYIRKLGQDLDPGIDEESLRIATVLAPEGSGVADTIAALLNAYFADVNARGGLYGRSVELVIGRASARQPTPDAVLRQLLVESKIFALVAPMISGYEKAVVEVVEGEGLPLIGPFAVFPQVEFPLNRQVFYLYSGLASQGQALVEFAKEAAPAPAVILYPAAEAMVSAVDQISAVARRAGWESVERRALPASAEGLRGLVGDLAQRGIEIVFFLGPGPAAASFFAAAEAMAFTPRVYAAGTQVGRRVLAAPAAFDGKIFLAYPTLPGDTTRRGIETYRRLAEKHSLPDAHFAAQITALAAAELLTEGLKQAGRDLSRERLIMALEGLFDHATGLTPPLSFGPNRRIGAQGAYVVPVDLANAGFKSASGWIEVR